MNPPQHSVMNVTSDCPPEDVVDPSTPLDIEEINREMFHRDNVSMDTLAMYYYIQLTVLFSGPLEEGPLCLFHTISFDIYGSRCGQTGFSSSTILSTLVIL